VIRHRAYGVEWQVDALGWIASARRKLFGYGFKLCIVHNDVGEWDGF